MLQLKELVSKAKDGVGGSSHSRGTALTNVLSWTTFGNVLSH